MDLPSITAAALTLYKEQSPDNLRSLLADALAEHHRMTWSQFLEKSGTLERLAECMVLMGTGYEPWEFDDHAAWRDAIGLPANKNETSVGAHPELYPALCAVFGVPAIQVEVALPSARWSPNPEGWSAPSVPLALATLREGMNANEFRAEEPDVIQRAPSNFVWLASAPGKVIQMTGLRDAVRQHAPSATQYRVRAADGEWVTRGV